MALRLCNQTFEDWGSTDLQVELCNMIIFRYIGKRKGIFVTLVKMEGFPQKKLKREN